MLESQHYQEKIFGKISNSYVIYLIYKVHCFQQGVFYNKINNVIGIYPSFFSIYIKVLT